MGQPEFGDMSLQIPEEVVLAVDTELVATDIDVNINPDPDPDINADANPNSDPDINADVNPFENSEITPTEDSSLFSQVATEITSFANQDNSISVIAYDLKITGLDTKEILVLFKEAMEDSKFGWISQDIFLKIKNGECELKDLNPIQAFVLAKRIQFLDIDMNWTQNVQA